MRTGLVINPEVHALLLQGAAAASLLTRFLIFSRNPGSLAARMHAIFGIAVAWWLFCLAEVASATSAEAIEFYVRLSQIAVGMLPAVVYHLHVSITGDQRDLDRAILAHYGISLLITLFCMTSPLLFSEPYRYSWGPYPSYTLWGLIPMAWFLLVLIEVPLRYRQQMKRYPPGTLVQQKLRALYLGNTLAPVVMVDFLPAFGIAIYPFSYLISLVMHIATLFGALRFHLIEITTYIAAEKILNTMSDALIIIDRDGLIRAVNPAANQLFRCEDRLMIHRPVADLISDPALLAVVCMPIEQTLSNHEAEYLRTDGESRVLNLTMTDLQERGAVLGRIVTIRDVTDLRNAESDNERLQEEVRQAQKLETLGVMAGGIAHDFNNLLMAVFGSADLAQSKQFMGASIEKELRTIRSAAERGAELTNQLLTYAGEGRSVKAEVDLNVLIEGMRELMHTAISKKARLTLDLAPHALWVMVDASQIRQILLNLVSNASEALNGKPGAITIRTGPLPGAEQGVVPGDPSDASVFFEVEDSGLGMDETTRERMFEPFFSTKFTGRGLGLSLTLGIVRAHSGRIEVETDLDQGTRIRVTLPSIAPPGDRPDPPVLRRDEWQGSGLVLLADDEAQVRWVTQQMLERMGFEVLEAKDGSETLLLFQRHQQDIRALVLDLTMPGMSGTEVMEQVRTLAGAVPTVLISGYAEWHRQLPESADQLIFLRKPFSLRDLSDAIRSVIG